MLPPRSTRVSEKGVSMRSESSRSTRSNRRVRARWLLLCILNLPGVAGCRNARHEECRAFVYAVNTRLAEIDRVTAQGSAEHSVNPADMRHLADLYEKLAEKADKISIHSTELQQLRERYRTMVLDAARLARSIADSLESKDLEAAMKAHEQFSAVVSREDELVSLVNAFCRQNH
jgi:hypothetical protein